LPFKTTIPSERRLEPFQRLLEAFGGILCLGLAFALLGDRAMVSFA